MCYYRSILSEWKSFCDTTHALYQVILKGSDTELPIIADELRRSAASIIKLTKESPHNCGDALNNDRNTRKRSPEVKDYAHDLLLLIGNRKFCQHIVASSPMTAIAFFEAMAAEQKYGIPIGQFAKNISTEALINKNSILYHEDEGYRSGLIGYVKPFSRTIYGNYRLVEALSAKHGSPLDVHHEAVWSWDATQLKAYCRSVMLTWENYIDAGNWYQHSSALYRAFGTIKDSCHDIYKLDASESYSTDIHKRLSVAVDFFKEAIEFLDKKEDVPNATLRVHNNQQENFYDYLATHVFEIISYASSVKSPADQCWVIHHTTVWTAFFRSYNRDGQTWKIVRHKLRRQLYNEVCQLGKFPNYKSAGILGFLLNVMGLRIGDKENRNRGLAQTRVTIKSHLNGSCQASIKSIKVVDSSIIQFFPQKRTIHHGINQQLYCTHCTINKS